MAEEKKSKVRSSPRNKLLIKEVFDSSCASNISDSPHVTPYKNTLLDYMEPLEPDDYIFSGEQNVTRNPNFKSLAESSTSSTKEKGGNSTMEEVGKKAQISSSIDKMSPMKWYVFMHGLNRP